jgi:hypothetical protein
LVLILQQPSSNLMGPNIVLMIFLSKIITLFIRFSLSTHVSEAYVTIGRLTYYKGVI